MRTQKRENRRQQAVTMAVIMLIAFFALTKISLSERDAPEQLNNSRKKIRNRSKQKTQERSQKGDDKGIDGFDTLRTQPEGFDAYKVIVTKNLFRPFGWTEKKRGRPSYTLVGTIIVTDGGNSKALILDKNTKKTYYVAVGDKIGNATVEKITSKKVALRQPNGGLLELKLGPMQFLNVPRRIPTSGGSSRQATRPGEPGEPLSRTHQIEGGTVTFGHPVSREEAVRLYDMMLDRRRRMQERLSRYRSQGRL